MNQSTKLKSKEIKSDNFCYRKVGGALTKWGAMEKSPILLSQYWSLSSLNMLLKENVNWPRYELQFLDTK